MALDGNPLSGGRSWALQWQSLGAVVRSWDVTIYLYIYIYTLGHQTIPVRFNWVVFARPMHSTSVIRWHFWASVSFLLPTSSWQEPFGESLRLTIDSKTMSIYTFELVIRLSKVNCRPFSWSHLPMSIGWTTGRSTGLPSPFCWFAFVDVDWLNNWPLYRASFSFSLICIVGSHDNNRSVLSQETVRSHLHEIPGNRTSLQVWCFFPFMVVGEVQLCM